MIKPAISLVIFTTSLVASIWAAPVSLHQDTKGKWELRQEGKPMPLKGAGGYTLLPELKAAGANTVRTWNAANSEWFNVSAYLDEAEALGLAVMLGLEVERENLMDYRDPAALKAQRERLRADVRFRKSHPALLLWAVGNEVEWGQRNLEALIPMWKELNELVRMTKEEDPDHPTLIVLAGDDDWKIQAVIEHVPDVDILGINTYGNYDKLPAKLDRLGWKKPFIITEYGPTGWWSAPKTEWQAVKEPAASEKAGQYRQLHTSGALADPRCLGSYAFIWANKEEATLTYFGTHLADNTPTAIVDGLEEIWTGKPPSKRSPKLTKLDASWESTRVAPGSPLAVTATMDHAEGLETTWWLATDRSAETKSGDTSENQHIRMIREWKTAAPATRFEAPSEPDYYRLYGLFRNAAGRVETISLPFAVDER